MLKYMCKLFMVSIYCGSVNSNFAAQAAAGYFGKAVREPGAGGSVGVG